MLKNLNKSVRSKQFFAFGKPLNHWFKNGDLLHMIWKDSRCAFLGCSDVTAEHAGETTSSAIGKTDHDVAWHSSAHDFQENDKQVLTSGVTKLFVEEADTTFGYAMNMLSVKAPLLTASKQICGIFAVCFEYNKNNLVEATKVINKMGILNSSSMPFLQTLSIINNQEFTKCEKQVLYLLVYGKSARETGEILYRSRRTIEDHIVNIKDKLGCRTKSELIEKVLDEGLLQ
jgi:DNA-binding CsgD family transcriptional regulator